MRDPERIDKFLLEVGKLWKIKYPDQRFGQLMLNFFGWAMSEKGDPFYWEEDKFITYFKEFCNDKLNG